MRLSVIIPTLNEAAQLEKHLPAVLKLADEVCLSDGGSTDETLRLACELGVIWVEGPSQRGSQLNRGAYATTGDLLLFLHADTVLPEDAGVRVREAIGNGALGGGFRLRFRTRHPLMRFAGRMIDLRTRLSRCPLGDQAQFVRRDVFEELGGYREWPILEDLDFARRLKRRGSTALLSPPVVTDARRYLRQGIVRTLLINWMIFALYFGGVSPHRLARLYRPNRRCCDS
jgi:rSAM/selenodomain-associated transferase 2